jgi:hypothetical protein
MEAHGRIIWMKRLRGPRRGVGLARSIHGITDYRVPQALEMEANLVGATGKRTRLKESRAIAQARDDYKIRMRLQRPVHRRPHLA